ncbi:redoxin domain-containing protein [Planctomycetota bacterium]|nr:redoxin domain-containing protein [Planctomycetota bacterium]
MKLSYIRNAFVMAVIGLLIAGTGFGADEVVEEKKPQLKSIVIQGKAIDAKTGEPVTNLTFTLGQSWRSGKGRDSVHTSWFDSGYMSGMYSVTQDDNGYKLVYQFGDGVMGMVQTDEELEQLLALRIIAPGYYPIEKEGIALTKSPVTWDLKLEPAPDRSGVIKSSAGEPIWNASVQIVQPQNRIQVFGPIVIESGYGDRLPLKTDLEGRFELPALRPPFKLVALAPEGYLVIDHKDVHSGTEFTLKPWKEISGSTSHLGQAKPAQHVTVSGYMVEDDNEFNNRIQFAANTFSDQQGKFRFPFVPDQQLKVSWNKGQVSRYDYESTKIMSEKVKPGSAPVDFNLSGYIVAGQFVNYDMKPFKKSDRSYMDYNAYLFSEEEEKRYPLNVADDGTFTAYNVNPGKLSVMSVLNISNYQNDNHQLFNFNSEFEVKGDDANVVVLDPIKPDVASKKLGLGSMAPEFTFKVLNLKNPMKSNEEKMSKYKGKYILLNFWATWNDDVADHHKEMTRALETFKDKGLVVIGLSLDDNMAAPLNYYKKNKNQFVHGYLGDWAEDTVTDEYSIDELPSNVLIDTNGYIVSKNLHIKAMYETIEAQVEQAE